MTTPTAYATDREAIEAATKKILSDGLTAALATQPTEASK